MIAIIIKGMREKRNDFDFISLLLIKLILSVIIQGLLQSRETDNTSFK